MKRRRGKRCPKGQRKGHWPSIYIRSFGAIQPGDKVVLWLRVSSGLQNASGSNTDQKVELRAVVEARGATVVAVVRFTGPAKEAEADLFEASKSAAEAGAMLLAESTSRFARHPNYHPKHRPHLVPGLQELSDLSWVCGDVPLVTLHDPDITWRDERALQSKRGQRQKGNRGGRPTKRTPGYKKRRRERLLPEVRRLMREGMSYRAIARTLETDERNVRRWVRRFSRDGRANERG